MVSIPVWLAWLIFGAVLLIIWLSFLLGNFLAFRTAELRATEQRSRREEALVRENRQLQEDLLHAYAMAEEYQMETQRHEQTITELRQIVESLSASSTEEPTVSWPSSSVSSSVSSREA